MSVMQQVCVALRKYAKNNAYKQELRLSKIIVQSARVTLHDWQINMEKYNFFFRTDTLPGEGEGILIKYVQVLVSRLDPRGA